MIKVNENSYITIEEADLYLSEFYTKFAPLRVIWSVLDTEEKENYLRCSLTELESLKFVGRKFDMRQKLSFPRVKTGESISYHPLARFSLQNDSETPEEVKQAQVENALAMIAKECASQTDKQFMIMQSLGVMKNIKYNKREAGDIGMGDELKGSGGMSKGLTSKSAEKMLRGWLGSFRG